MRIIVEQYCKLFRRMISRNLSFRHISWQKLLLHNQFIELAACKICPQCGAMFQQLYLKQNNCFFQLMCIQHQLVVVFVCFVEATFFLVGDQNVSQFFVLYNIVLHAALKHEVHLPFSAVYSSVLFSSLLRIAFQSSNI